MIVPYAREAFPDRRTTQESPVLPIGYSEVPTTALPKLFFMPKGAGVEQLKEYPGPCVNTEDSKRIVPEARSRGSVIVSGMSICIKSGLLLVLEVNAHAAKVIVGDNKSRAAVSCLISNVFGVMLESRL